MLAASPLLGYPWLRAVFFKRIGGALKVCLLDRVCLETVYHFLVKHTYNMARPVRFLRSKLLCMCTSQAE